MLILLFNLCGIHDLPAQSTYILPDEVNTEYKKLEAGLDYNRMVKPILADKCFACHGNDRNTRKADLRLDKSENAYAPLPQSPGRVAISPKNPGKSELILRILSQVQEYVMPQPQSNLILSAKEKAILVKWIEEGAEYQPHWSFLPIKPLQIPEIKLKDWANNPIDYFIGHQLEKQGLTPSPAAPRELLLRRLYLDLTGLPPGIKTLDEFLNDTSPDAYEKQVDKLLASAHYGEKMAMPWLDLARFADSHGYTVDRLRNMSPYRDWVIRSFNANMPYDHFISQQLAGDLMPNPTTEMLIATAFNRNHPQNMEGGIIEIEFQTEYAVDRTNTFGEAFIGLSVGCARCHDHKFDPISHKNYYQLFSFFNQVKEAGQIAWNNAMPTPTILLPGNEKKKVIAFIEESINKSKTTLDSASHAARPAFEAWMQTGSYKKLAAFDYPQAGLKAYYPLNGDLSNYLNPDQIAQIRRETDTTPEQPIFDILGKTRSLVLDGDGYLDLLHHGRFRKSDPFSIGIWIKIPSDFKEGVIFHKSIAERLYNFRGYHVYFKEGRLQINMAHTAPSNALTRWTKNPVPLDQWIQLTLTYDGSSSAYGFNLFIDGLKIELETTMDQLYKDISFGFDPEPALQVGGWWRGLGFKGGRVSELLIYDRLLTDHEIKILARKSSWLSLGNKPHDQLSIEEKSNLWDYYNLAEDSTSLELRAQLQLKRRALSDSTENIQEIMVMQETGQPVKTYLLKRGNYMDPGEEVFPSTPEFILPMGNDLPRNRYGLSQWLTNKNHPLTARVAVNRLWQIYFGNGLVKTTEDFGNQGELPSHPELLDWLAGYFMDSGWDIKKLNKLIVMSATYRQDSRANIELLNADPENKFLARGPSKRLSAEVMRDLALASSGLINDSVGGNSIKAYQPEGLWEINSATYQSDSVPEIYRRSLYILVKRSVPNPTLALFDAPDRSSCISRRQRTNTPSQALVVLNDPTFVESAKVMGEYMTRKQDPEQAIREIYRKVTARDLNDQELKLLLSLQRQTNERFKKDPRKAQGWLDSGFYLVDPDLYLVQIAANAVVASVILNSDASIMNR
ncbi:MAG: DUF1553 domain-containing protein [Saprospiraceae bacterium]|nr:DUF1553 domain-containing protein [Saprospiraceae bacterium]